MEQKIINISLKPKNNNAEGGVSAAYHNGGNARKKTRRNKKSAILSLFMTTLVIFGVAAFAAIKPEETPEPAVTAPVVLNHGFRGVLGHWELTRDEVAAVTTVVASVARGESPLTQQAVAQALRNTCEDFDMTMSEVIAEFSWPCDYTGKFDYDTVNAVQKVIDGIPAVSDRIHFCYNPDLQDGEWFESGRNFVCQVGNLRFYK